ncbi:hypothetical protein [Peribacillus sp. NPDC097295]|uniref:hypothetical protein n=1 Tax=Peribacillus sp. NPDC097295 TaxID=3364402 RepID=UPI0038160951
MLYYLEKATEKIQIFNKKLKRVSKALDDFAPKLFNFITGIIGIVVTLRWLF